MVVFSANVILDKNSDILFREVLMKVLLNI